MAIIYTLYLDSLLFISMIPTQIIILIFKFFLSGQDSESRGPETTKCTPTIKRYTATTVSYMCRDGFAILALAYAKFYYRFALHYVITKSLVVVIIIVFLRLF